MSINWASDIPTNWKISESQFVLNYQKRDVREDDEIVTAFRDGQVTLRSNRRTDGFTMAEKEIGYQHICVGDLVVHAMDGGFGAIGVSDSSGKASPVVHAYTSTLCDLRFIAYQLRAAVDAGWIAAQAKGIRVRSTQFDRPALASLKIAYPSLETQQRIADYLDRETAEIDAAVVDLDRYVELLEKRRLAVIEENLNHSSYQMCPVGLISKVTLGKMVTSEHSSSVGTIRNYLRAAHVQPWGRLDFTVPQKTMPFTDSESIRLDLRAGDVVVVEGGAGFGRSGFLEEGLENWGFQNSINRVRVKPGMADGRFVNFMLIRALINGSIEMAVDTATLPHFTAEKLSRFRIPLCSLEQQIHFVKKVSAELNEIDSLVAESTKLRELLLKRRSVLITDVVTGRKQV